jgi:hypothetical protein
MNKVRLTHKLADVLNGIDVSHVKPGDVIDLPPRDADLLIAEGWAFPAEGDRGTEPSGADRSDSVRQHQDSSRDPDPDVGREPDQS